MQQSVASVIVGSLAAAGITHAFAVPGESYLPLLDAMLDAPIRLITCRHEASACNMAEAQGKLTGLPGVCMVTRGPGASHAAIGLHTAQQDSTPLLLFVGQVGDDCIGREAFQEVDYGVMFGQIAKKVILLAEPDRVGEQMAFAISLAMSGRPGPVVIVLPDDKLGLPTDAVPVAPAPVFPPAPSPGAMRALAGRLAAARRPLLLLGGPGPADPALAARVAGHLGLPVLTAWRRKDHFNNTHPHYGGELGLGANTALLALVKEADLLLVVGARLTENETQGYQLFDQIWASEHLVHACGDAQALGRTWQPALAIHSATAPMLEAMLALPGASRADWVAQTHAVHAAWIQPTSVQSGVNPAEIIDILAERLGPDAIFTNGAGNFAAWVHRFRLHQRAGTQLAPISGAMGYGLPAAIAASILRPEQPVVAICGDGDFLMAAGELATVAHEGCRPLFVVIDNGQYGTIRMHQANCFPGRPVATRLTNPDFAALARSFWLHAERVTETDQFAGALERSLGRASLIHVLTDPDEIAPGRRLAPGQ